MNPEPLLEVTGLDVEYKGAGLGVHGLDLEVDRGEIVAMLGANGAGKTTTLRAISGFLPGEVGRVVSGDIRFQGESLGKSAPHTRVRKGISIIPEHEKVFRELTVAENLRVSSRKRKGRDVSETLDFVYDLFPRLTERRDIEAGYLSGGERQMLAIGRALMTGPSLLLADEVSLGIAPVLVVQMLDALKQINREEGVTILAVEQNAAAALRIADRVYVLENGRAVLHGTPRELLQHDDFHSTYFGLGDDVVADHEPANEGMVKQSDPQEEGSTR